MTTCSLELKVILCYKWWNYYLQFKMNKMSGENKLFIILFKLAKLVKSIYLYFKENSNEALS